MSESGDMERDRARDDEDDAAIVEIVEIVNKKGLHARASAKFVKTAEGFEASVTVRRSGEAVGGTSIMGLMMLAAGPGTQISIEATGTEAAAAVSALVTLVRDGFGEDD